MTYEERPSRSERPEVVRRRWDECPPAEMWRTRAPEWHLERWKVVRDLVVGWYGDDRPDTVSVPQIVRERAGWMDDVQRAVVERLFAGWRAMFPKDGDVAVDLDPETASVHDHELGAELRVTPTVAIRHRDGTVEHVRLKTGRSRTGPDEAAVLHAGSEPGVVQVDALVSDGVVEEIAEPPDAGERVRQLLQLAVRDVPSKDQTRRGPWCFRCAGAPRCGQYPPMGPGTVRWSSRSLTISKTALGLLGTCERRVAWDRLHQIPGGEGGSEEVGGPRLAGLRFHEVAASALRSERPEAVVAAAMSDVEPSEAAELGRLWDNHLRLWAADGEPEVRRTEHQAGITFVVPGIDVDDRDRESVQPVGVTMLAVLDVTGREADGTPMVIEHRTGAVAGHAHLEAELYAVAAASEVQRWTGEWPERIAVHLHQLRSADPACHRSTFDADDLERARQALAESACRVASWHPYDSLSPPHRSGPWCAGCHHRALCETFRA